MEYAPEEIDRLIKETYHRVDCSLTLETFAYILAQLDHEIEIFYANGKLWGYSVDLDPEICGYYDPTYYINLRGIDKIPSNALKGKSQLNRIWFFYQLLFDLLRKGGLIALDESEAQKALEYEKPFIMLNLFEKPINPVCTKSKEDLKEYLIDWLGEQSAAFDIDQKIPGECLICESRTNRYVREQRTGHESIFMYRICANCERIHDLPNQVFMTRIKAEKTGNILTI